MEQEQWDARCKSLLETYDGLCGVMGFSFFAAWLFALPERARVTNFIEWLADQPCEGNGSGMLCRFNSSADPSWCCPPCQAHLIRYGAPASEACDCGHPWDHG
jgi:hypothetical protein